MMTTLEQLIALLPLLIIGLTIVVMMLFISWQRNHFLNAILSVIGLNTAFISLWFVNQVKIIDIVPLIRVDSYAILYISLVLISSLATCTFAYPWLENHNEKKEEFYLLVLIATLGGVLLATANHMVILFLGIELISLPLFGLIGYNFCQNDSLKASIKYTILSTVASSFLLFGISLIYVQTGTLSFFTLSKNLGEGILYDHLLLTGLGMMIVGFGFKLSLVPFHLWTSDVYQGSPAPVSILLTTVSKISIFGVIVRLFSYTSVCNYKTIRIVLAIIALFSIIVGNLMALNQTNIKRLLGYSSISHLGYLMVTLIALKNSEMSIETINIYLTGYLLSNLAAFGVVSIVSGLYRGSDTDSLLSYHGLFWRYPVLSIAMTVVMFSLAGIPMTLGFIGKFYLLAISVQVHLWWLTAGIVIGSAIGLFYYLRVVATLYSINSSRQVNHILQQRNRQYVYGSIVVLISALLVLILGIYPQLLINLVKHTTLPI